MRAVLSITLGLLSIVQAAMAESPATQPDTWRGFSHHDFVVNDRKAILVAPDQQAAGKPWIWRTEFFGHEPQADLALLGRGFHVAYIDVQNLYGAPAAMEHMDALYARLTQQTRLSPTPVLEGFSRGGLFALNWAARNPGKVAGLYLDAPVCDFRSWPGGAGRSARSAPDWERLKRAYGFASDAEAMAYRLNPIDNLAPLAKARIPILSICGDADEVVPLDENTRIVEQRYKQLGGDITVIIKPGVGHHPHSLKDPAPIVDFVLRCVDAVRDGNRL